MAEHRNEDGSYSTAEPIGWQGNTLDWEVYRDESPMRAEAYWEDVLLEVVTARTGLMLAFKMHRAGRRHGLKTTVFG